MFPKPVITKPEAKRRSENYTVLADAPIRPMFVDYLRGSGIER